MRSLVRAAHALATCTHPPARVQTFSVMRADIPVPLVRCHACGAVRWGADAWLVTLGAVVVLRELGDAVQRRRERGLYVARTARPAAIPLSDLLVYECEASDEASPGAFVPAPHLRALLAGYVATCAAQAADTATLDERGDAAVGR